MRILPSLLLAACAGAPEAPPEPDAAPVVTVLWSGRDGVLAMGPDGTDHSPIGDPAVLSTLVPGRGFRLTYADGKVVGAELVPHAPIVQSLPEYPLTGTVVSIEPEHVQVDH